MGIVGASIALMFALGIVPGLPFFSIVILLGGGIFVFGAYVVDLPNKMVMWFFENYYRLFMFYFEAIIIKIARKDGAWWTSLF